jgi:hypothetical protein
MQLEVSRAWRGRDVSIVFEPAIVGSERRADLEITRKPRTFLVETTSLSRAADDLQREAFEHELWQLVKRIESRTDARIDVQLSDDFEANGVEGWLHEIEEIARSVVGQRARVVESAVGRAEIWSAQGRSVETVFNGGLQVTDGWRRLARTLHGKARQSAGEQPVWLRVDALDGFFQLTGWPRMSWSDRIERLADAAQSVVAGFDHVAGIVLSSSASVAIGATEPAQVDERIDTERGTGLRRLISDHVVR